MVYLIGASSLYRAFNSSPYSLRSTIYKKSTAIPGLSLNPNSNNRLKDLGFLLERGQLRDRSDLVCWHDVINNSITEHKSNGNKALTVEQLLQILKKHSHKFAAIIYCQRFSTPNILEELRTLNILIIDVKKKLMSKRKQKTPKITSELQKVHPWPELERNFITTILKKSTDLYSLVLQKRSKTRKRKPRKKKKA